MANSLHFLSPLGERIKERGWELESTQARITLRMLSAEHFPRRTGLNRAARQLRGGLTDAERKLWFYLRRRGLNGFKFRRQHRIDCYIADFCCPERKLIIELDGGQHLDAMEKDAKRTEFLNARGFRVIRFWDNQVLLETEVVLREIWNVLSEETPSP